MSRPASSLRQYHSSERLNTIQSVKENLYKIGRLVNEVRSLGIRIDQSEVTAAKSAHESDVARFVGDELHNIGETAENGVDVFNRVRKLSKAMGRLKID